MLINVLEPFRLYTILKSTSRTRHKTGLGAVEVVLPASQSIPARNEVTSGNVALRKGESNA